MNYSILKHYDWRLWLETSSNSLSVRVGPYELVVWFDKFGV